jgi:hypothetical protein
LGDENQSMLPEGEAAPQRPATLIFAQIFGWQVCSNDPVAKCSGAAQALLGLVDIAVVVLAPLHPAEAIGSSSARITTRLISKTFLLIEVYS